MDATPPRPAGLTVFERGWLSSNNILLDAPEGAAIVDTGYSTHAGQTVELLKHALGPRPLAVIANTHLHSDHCGGNAALQRAFPSARTLIPPGQRADVERWDDEALSYSATGQRCERFHVEAVMQPGSSVRLGRHDWEVHAAPGHDPHSVILFEPASATLISADALWQNGFGVVFPELEGESAFGLVGATLDVIEWLAPRWVIPGHGSPFGTAQGELSAALARARSRLDGFVRDPKRHASHSAKVLLKFKLLELQQVPIDEFEAWALRTRYFGLVWRRFFPSDEALPWVRRLVAELEAAGAAKMVDGVLTNA